MDSTTEAGTWIDDEMYDSGNYFRTKDLACQCRLELLSTLRKFHEDIKNDIKEIAKFVISFCFYEFNFVSLQQKLLFYDDRT